MEVAKRAGIPEIEAAARAGVMTDEAISQVVNGKKVTLTTAYRDWDKWMTTTLAARTRVNNAMYFNSFANHISKGKWNTAINSIKPEQIDEWVNNGGKKGTRRVRLAALRSFWKWANAEGITSRDPSKLVKVKLDSMTHKQKETKKRDRYINAAQFESIVELYSEKDEIEWWMACHIAVHAGLRMGDIFNLEWDCIDLPCVNASLAGTMTVWTDKRDKRVELDINDELAGAIGKYLRYLKQLTPTGQEFDKGTHVFGELRDSYNDPKKRAYLSRLFSRHCKKLGIEASFHDWRHTYATNCKIAGLEMPHIASNLGHSSTETTEIYVDEEKADNVILMPTPGNSTTDLIAQLRASAGV
jgi:integrase